MVYGASKRPCLCSKTAVLKRICDRQRAQNADMAEKINKIMYETDRQRFHNEVVKDIQTSTETLAELEAFFAV